MVGYIYSRIGRFERYYFFCPEGTTQRNAGSWKADRSIDRSLGQQVAQLSKQAADTHQLAEQSKAQADRTKEIAQTSRDALIQVQRAVMSPDDIIMLRNSDNGAVNQFNFVIRWKNTGTTPTKNLTIHHSWKPMPIIPNDFNYPELWNPGEPETYTPAFASPQKSLDTLPTEVSPEQIKAVQKHLLRLYFWGWAKYRDVFKSTPRHISEYCVEVNGFRGDPLDTDPSHPVVPTTSNCPSYNCHDEECKVK